MTPLAATECVKTFRENALADYPAFAPLYEQMHRLRDLLNRKHQSRRSCKPLARELLAFIDRLAASCFEP